MMDRKMVNFIKEQYPPGTRIRLNSMEDPYAPILPGTEGEVDYVDDEGQIFMKWDNGRTLPLAPGEDSFTVLPPKLTTLKLYMPLTADLYPVKDWHGGKVHRIRSHVLHLMRGQVFELEGYHFFTMGGAKSHDTEDGILEPGAPDFERKLLMLQRKPRARYRINHISWWAQEMPSEEEYAEARKNLAKVDWAVDYVITHCAPTSIALMENRHNEADPLTDFLQEVKERAHYHYWLFGHYHDNRAIDEKHILLWEQIVQVI